MNKYEALKENLMAHDKKLKGVQEPILEYSLQDATDEMIRN